MKLKCIGGPNNGEFWNTYDDKPRVGEQVQTYRFPDKVEFSEISFSNRYIYIVEQFSYYNHKWLFLKYSNDETQITLFKFFEKLFKYEP